MEAISYHDTVKHLHPLGLSGKGPFAQPGWFALLEEAGHRPLLAVASGENASVCLPLTTGPDGLEVFTNWYAFTWSPLVKGEPRPELFCKLAKNLAEKRSRVNFAKLAPENPLTSKLEAGFRTAGWTVIREECDTNHYLPVNGRSYAEYIASRPGKLRTTLKRKAKKVEVILKRTFDPADWAAYEAIYAESWKPEEGDPALLRAFAESESAKGHYLFGMALAEGEPVAAQFWTVEGGTAYIHKLAHLESAQKLSPGTTLTAALFEEVIDRDGVSEVDFGTGNDGYKADWMEATRPRFSLTCLRPGSPANWPIIAKAALRKLVSRQSAG